MVRLLVVLGCAGAMLILFPYRDAAWVNGNAFGWTIWQVLMSVITTPLAAVVLLAIPQLQEKPVTAPVHPTALADVTAPTQRGAPPVRGWGFTVVATALAIAFLVMLCQYAVNGATAFNGLLWEADSFPPPMPWPTIGSIALPVIGGVGAIFVGRQAFVLSGGREEFIAFFLFSALLSGIAIFLPFIT